MAKAPAFQFYAQDFLTGTSEMSNAEVGAYIRFLCNQWIKDGIVNDMKLLTRLCQGDTEGIEVALEKFKVCEDGKLRNEKLEIVRKEQDEYRQAKADAGAAGAKKRWGSKNSTPIVLPSGLPLANGIANYSPSSSSSSSPSSDIDYYNQVREDKFFEILRQKAPKTFLDNQLRTKARHLFNQYKDKKIENLGALINKVVGDMKPDSKVKFYNPGSASYGFMEIEQWEKIKDRTELKFHSYEAV